MEFIQNKREETNFLLSALTKLGRVSIDAFAECLKIAKVLIGSITPEYPIQSHCNAFAFINFIINFDPKAAHFFTSLLKVAIGHLRKFDYLL